MNDTKLREGLMSTLNGPLVRLILTVAHIIRPTWQDKVLASRAEACDTQLLAVTSRSLLN